MTTLSPRTFFTALALVACLLALPACSTPASNTGMPPASEISARPNTAFIVKGQTTRAQLLSALGQATSASRENDGGETLNWAEGGAMADALASIPYVGGVISSIEVKTSALMVELDTHGVVSDFSHTSRIHNAQTASRD